MTQQNSSNKKLDDAAVAEKADQVEDDVGNAGYMPNHGMLNIENTMTQQNFNEKKTR
jgi:hypothetical protein